MDQKTASETLPQAIRELQSQYLVGVNSKCHIIIFFLNFSYSQWKGT